MRAALGRWWRPLLFLAWLDALLALLGRGGHTTFLRPEFGVALALASVVLLLFLAVSVLRPQSGALTSANLVRAGTLLLPLLCLHLARGGTLGAADYQRRAVGTPSVQTASAPVHPATADTEAITIDALYMSPTSFAGRRVSLLGMARHDEELRGKFGDNALAVFRFVVTCCAADAQPLAVVVLPTSAFDFPDGAWVEVEGTFEIRSVDGADAPVLKDAKLRRAPTPQEPYLY